MAPLPGATNISDSRRSNAVRSADGPGEAVGMISASLGRSSRAYALEKNRAMRSPSAVS
jgi:hypothetical protein